MTNLKYFQKLLSALVILLWGSVLNTSMAQNAEAEEEFQPYWSVVDEVGYGFLKIDGAWACKATIGACYSFTDKFYAQGQIGYNSCNIYDLVKTGRYSSVTLDSKMHFITIPLEVGYRLTTEDRLWGIIPFAGFGFNIGLNGKSTFDDVKTDLEIGGKIGVEARVGLRLTLSGFQIIGSYHAPMNSKQEDFFGDEAYPELAIGYQF